MYKSLLTLYLACAITMVSNSFVFPADKQAGEKGAGGLKISGVLFIGYSYDLSYSEKGESFSKVDIERTYLTFESAIADKAKIKVTTDIYQNSKVLSFKTEDGSKPDNTDSVSVKVPSYYDGWSVRLKNAYVDLDLIPLTMVRIGMIGTPWIPLVESAWGYRFVKPTLADAEKLFSSADLGAGLIIKLPKSYGEAMLGILNGPGYSKPEEDKYKDIVPRITIVPLPNDEILKGLALSGYYYLGERAKGDTSLDRTRLGTLLSFSYDFLKVGGEFDMSMDQDLNKGEIENVNGAGFSAFGEVRLKKFLPSPLDNVGILARIDAWDPNTGKEDDAHTTLIAGLSYSAIKNIRAVLSLQQTSYETRGKEAERQVLCQAEVKF